MNKRGSKLYWGAIIIAVLVYALILLLINTGILNSFYINLFNMIGINVMLAISLHLIIGITGQFSIGHAGFLSVGAYSSAIITMKLGLPFPFALLVAGIAAGIAGLLIGIPTLRLKGDYLAIATLGFGEIVRIVLLNIDYVGGAAGMRVSHSTTWSWVFFLALLTVLLIINFTNSTHGRVCIATREDEIAADAMGINTTLYKVIAFVLGAFFAGIAGGLYAHNFYFIQPVNFGFLKSFEILIFVVIGGLGSLTGSVIAATLLTIINIFLQDYPETRMIFYSLILILTMIYRPRGLMGNMELTQLLAKQRWWRKGGKNS